MNFFLTVFMYYQILLAVDTSKLPIFTISKLLFPILKMKILFELLMNTEIKKKRKKEKH